jgi:GNAT superfamily N-acetyltransferase
MNIRFAQVQDLEACFELDASFDTDYVWQMETGRTANAMSAAFRVTRLPRSMRVPVVTLRDQVAEHFERGECFLVAAEDSAITGYLDLTIDPWTRVAWLSHVTVASNRRRKGVGTALLRQAIKWVHDRQSTTLMAEVSTKNYPAGCFLQKHGFAFCGFNDRYYASRDIAIFFAATVK